MLMSREAPLKVAKCEGLLTLLLVPGARAICLAFRLVKLASRLTLYTQRVSFLFSQHSSSSVLAQISASNIRLLQAYQLQH